LTSQRTKSGPIILKGFRLRNQPFIDNAKKSKIAFVLILLVAISLVFSSRSEHSKQLNIFHDLDDGSCQLVSYVNPGAMREITVDYFVIKREIRILQTRNRY
jgi:hypothetical protein